MGDPTRYTKIIERVFASKYRRGAGKVDFVRRDLVDAAHALRIEIPKNLGDILYSFRYRVPLPESIRTEAPTGKCWAIRPVGKSRYSFVLVKELSLVPNPNLAVTKVPDATPGIIAMYSLSDEQALLAKVRYNRLVDIFTGVTCYSLQNHLRTTAPGLGQVETDEIYVGIDKKGAHYVFPIQAKGGRDLLNLVQIEQDVAVCESKFPGLLCRPLATQFMHGETLAMFELEKADDGLAITAERHYQLVPPEDVTQKDLDNYRSRMAD